MRVLLLGGTDLTLAVAQRLHDLGFGPAGVVHLGETVSISYNRQGFRNSRAADIEGWCTRNSVVNSRFTDISNIRAFAQDVSADFLLAAGWYHLIPTSLASQFSRGAAGLHASMLPKFRGGAPLPWAILTGVDQTGVTLFSLGDGIDDGPIYGQKQLAIGLRTRIAELVEAAELASLDLVADCIPRIAAGTLMPNAQSGTPTWCLQRVPEDGKIDWTRSVDEIDRLVRAVGRPYPGAFGEFEGRRITIWGATPAPLSLTVHGVPGQIVRLPIDNDPIVITGFGCLIIRAAEADGADVLPELRKASNRRFVS